MKSKKVLDSKILPVKLPIWSSVTCVLALDYWNAPEWLWGASGFLFLHIWVYILLTKLNEQKVNLLDKKSLNKKERISFKEILKEKINQ